MAGVSAQRIRADIDRLAGFGTRHTLSETESDTRGIGAARRWILSEFQKAADASGRTGELKPRVYLDVHPYKKDGRRITRDVDIVNVVMEVPGASPAARDRHYYVTGHYDSIPSINTDHESDAPGANDDASGTAVVIELARLVARERLDATVVFMATAAEEQGLIGARLHAINAKHSGRDIRAVLNNDIVGNPTAPNGDLHDGHIRVFSQPAPRNLTDKQRAIYAQYGTYSDGPSRQLARLIDEVARWHNTTVRPMLVFRKDRFGRGGDHSAFNDLDYPGVRFTEVVENYNHQHQDVRTEDGVTYGDTPELVDEHYTANVARLNAAALIHLANAPSAPTGVKVSGRTANVTLKWNPSPEPDTAGYEVVWRKTTSPVWQHAHDVGGGGGGGATTEIELPVSRDNHFFGVRAYDQDGYRSPVSFSAIGD
jgi:hypothetical protein